MNIFDSSVLSCFAPEAADFPLCGFCGGEKECSLPNGLRRDIEQLSGFDMSDVRVHYDSILPAQVNARAFAYGTDIYLGPGAEDTLAHEAWHVVQQKQGRVKANSSFRHFLISTDYGLEQEAQCAAHALISNDPINLQKKTTCQKLTTEPVIQRDIRINNQDWNIVDVMKSLRNPIRGLNRLAHLNSVVTDINNAPGLNYRTFTTWNDLILEVKIRNFGYLHVQTMTAYANRNLTWIGSFNERLFRTGPARISNYWAQNEFYRWTQGTLAFPSQSNCWETVLMAAVGTQAPVQGNPLQRNFGYDSCRADRRFVPRIVRDLLANRNDCRSCQEGQINAPPNQPYGIPIQANVITNIYIPNGRIVAFGQNGQHVAISTGRMRRSKRQSAINHFGRYGHEIIEINGDTPMGDQNTTGRVAYTTIEDRLSHPNYNMGITWGILPRVNFRDYY